MNISERIERSFTYWLSVSGKKDKKWLAEKLGVSYTRATVICKGKITVEMLDKVSNVFGVTPSEFLKIGEDMKYHNEKFNERRLKVNALIQKVNEHLPDGEKVE